MKNKLTEKQILFVHEYLIDLNASQAALRAGYRQPEYGRQLLTKPHVYAEIEKRKERREKNLQLNAENVVRELMLIGFSDITDYIEMGKQGITLKQFENLPAQIRRCISQVEQNDTRNGVVIKFRLYDKVRSLELLGKHLGLFLDRLDISGEIRYRNIDEKLSMLSVKDLRKIANTNKN